MRKLTEARRLSGEGNEVAEVYRVPPFTEAIFARSSNQFDGLTAGDAKKVKEIQRENTVLKRLLIGRAITDPDSGLRNLCGIQESSRH